MMVHHISKGEWQLLDSRKWYVALNIRSVLDSSKKELVEFVESLGSDQFNALLEKVFWKP